MKLSPLQSKVSRAFVCAGYIVAWPLLLSLSAANVSNAPQLSGSQLPTAVTRSAADPGSTEKAAQSSSWKGPAPAEQPRVLIPGKPVAGSDRKSDPSSQVWDKVSRPELRHIKRGFAEAPVEDHDPDSPADDSFRQTKESLTSTNLTLKPRAQTGATSARYLQDRIEEARQLRRSGAVEAAARMMADVLKSSGVPESVQKSALIELALSAHAAKRLVKAQQVFDHYRRLFPDDASIPEILLRQGLLYREMGAPGMAVIKFHSVLTMSLNYSAEHLEYYQRLVLHAQTEIADTYYLQGNFSEAVIHLKRLLQLESGSLNLPLVHYKLIRSLSNLGLHDELAGSAAQYLVKHSGSEYEPEVRFLLAFSFKSLGRVRDSIRQVNELLESQQAVSERNPENWRYWQQRTGNEIANQLFQESDYANALELYLTLVQLEKDAEWQVPILYQVGLVYEKMGAPTRAAETYGRIVALEEEIGTSGHQGLMEMLGIARWRRNFLHWEVAAQTAKKQLVDGFPSTTNSVPTRVP